MIFRLTLWFILCISPILAMAQESADSTMMKKFAEIYFQEKAISKELMGEFEQRIQTLDIDTELYKEYQRTKSLKKPLSPKLQLIENRVLTYKNEFENRKSAQVKLLCDQASLDHSIYLSLKKRYLSEIRFNRACQKYVSAYSNAEKDE
jgi:hypothetical protein